MLSQVLERQQSCPWSESQRLDSLIRFFVGTPYVGGTLDAAYADSSCSESLTVNLRELDCLTFVENVIALNRWLDRPEEESFARILQQIRYRGGVLDGYASRLHYTSEWIADNMTLGFVRPLELGQTQTYVPKVGFMSAHPQSYPALRGDSLQALRIRQIEDSINAHVRLDWIPKEAVASLEPQIPDGTLVAITTTIPGLDIGHLGFAVRCNGSVRLLHASSSKGQVVVSEETLSAYLAGISRFSGVILLDVR